MKTPAAGVRLACCAALWISLADRWAEELISGDGLQRPAHTQRPCFSWGGVHNQGHQKRWYVNGNYYQWEKTPPTVRGTQSKLEFHLNWQQGRAPNRSNIKAVMLTIYQTGTSWRPKQREDCWIGQICPDHWFRSSRHLEIEAIWYLASLSFCRASESCPTFSPGSVWHLSFTQVTTPPSLALPLSFSSSIVPGSEIQPGTANPAILSSPQAQYLPAWLISSQTMRW